MYPKTEKLRRLARFKFVPRLVSMWGIRKYLYLNPKLTTFAIASRFTAYLIYVLYGLQNGKIKQIEVITFVSRLILKWEIKKCQYFDPTFAVANSFTAYLIYVLYWAQKVRIKKTGVKNQIDIT